MKRTVAVLLIFAMLLPLAACGEKTPTPAPAEPAPIEPAPAEPAPAAPAEPAPVEPEPEPRLYTREEVQQAVCQTAMAYYYHRKYTQYDGASLMKDLPGTTRMMDTFLEAEGIGPDEYFYTWCSDFGYRVWRDATDWTYTASSHNFWTRDIVAIPADDPVTVYKYEQGVNAGSAAQAAAECRSLLEPGDLITYYIPSENNGHCMVYVGDIFGDGTDYIVHSIATGGGTIKWTGEDAGVNPIEPGGSVYLDKLDPLVFTEGNKRYLGNYTIFNIIRPVNAVLDGNGMAELTDNARARLEHPFLEVWKTLDRGMYTPVPVGETAEITVTLTNHSKEDYSGLKIVEPFPDGQTFVSASGNGSLQNGSICWTVDVPARKTVKQTFTFRAEGTPGEVVTFPAGKAASLKTRDITVQLSSGVLTEEEKQRIADAAGAIPVMLQDGLFHDLDSVNIFYRATIGYDPLLPTTFSELLSALTERKKPLGSEDKYVMMQKEEKIADNPLYRMMIQKHLIGRYAYTGQQEMHNRVMEFLPERYQPGDFFIGSSGSASSVLLGSQQIFLQIYLGGDDVLVITEAGVSVQSFADSIARNIACDFALAFRPCMIRE